MSKPESFILNSDFASFKNDDNGMATITMPASVSIGAGAVYTNATDLTVGSQFGENRIRIKASGEGSQYFLGMLGLTRTGTSGGFSTPYSLYALVTRTSATTVRCFLLISNPTGATLTTSSTPETFTFKVNTFISPVED